MNREDTKATSDAEHPASQKEGARTASLRVRRKPADRAPLVRLSWPSQPALGTLDFDDAEVQ